MPKYYYAAREFLKEFIEIFETEEERDEWVNHITLGDPDRIKLSEEEAYSMYGDRIYDEENFEYDGCSYYLEPEGSYDIVEKRYEEHRRLVKEHYKLSSDGKRVIRIKKEIAALADIDLPEGYKLINLKLEEYEREEGYSDFYIRGSLETPYGYPTRYRNIDFKSKRITSEPLSISYNVSSKFNHSYYKLHFVDLDYLGVPERILNIAESKLTEVAEIFVSVVALAVRAAG